LYEWDAFCVSHFLFYARSESGQHALSVGKKPASIPQKNDIDQATGEYHSWPRVLRNAQKSHITTAQRFCTQFVYCRDGNPQPQGLELPLTAAFIGWRK
jgi:hypothetical protein